MDTIYHLGLGNKKTLRQRFAEFFLRPTPSLSLLDGQYILMVDIWEGQGTIDWVALENGGVAGAFVRLNDMNGGHHMDSMFDTYWRAPTSLIRVPYFVYNPWVSGQSNFDFLVAHMPLDARAVALDVEVVYSGYSASSYASNVAQFVNLVKTRWHHVIYTAEWFLPYLSYWPTTSDYWWAQYPNALYTAETITWDRMREELLPYSGPANAGKSPATVLFWQCSGDKKILPGSTKPLDVNVAFMTLAQLRDFAGLSVPPAGPTLTHTIDVYDDGSLYIDGKLIP